MDRIDQPMYLFHRVGVDGKSATLAVYTQYVRRTAERREVRIPSLVSSAKICRAMYDLDRDVRVIEDRRQFSEWLGRGPWGTFTVESASRLIPHWLNEIECCEFRWELSNAVQSVAFTDCSVLAELATARSELDLRRLVGTSPDGDAVAYHMQITGNLVLTKLPLLAN